MYRWPPRQLEELWHEAIVHPPLAGIVLPERATSRVISWLGPCLTSVRVDDPDQAADMDQSLSIFLMSSFKF